MYRKSLLCLIAAGAFAIPACGDDDPASGGDGAHEHGGTAGKGGSNSGGTSEGGEPGTGGTRTGGTGGTAGTSEGGEPGTGGTATGGDGGGGGAAEPCESGDPPQCADSETIVLCDPDADSTLQSFSCEDFCGTLGLESGACVEDGADTSCACGDPMDAECFAGAEEVCSCLQGTEIECLTDADRFAWYLACLDGEEDSEDVVRCFAQGSTQACFRTVEQCVP